MATTTNYGWVTPDDTDLVKDGAAAIRTLGTSVDTTVHDNEALAIAKTFMAAKGDLISATANDTPSILTVGANGTTLVADSAEATGLKWAAPAGGIDTYTQVAASALTGLSTITVSSLTYKKLIIQVYAQTSASTVSDIRVRFNGSTTAADYDQAFHLGAYNSSNLAYENYQGAIDAFDVSSSGNGGFWLNLDNGTSTSYKPISFVGGVTSSGVNPEMFNGFGKFNGTAAITSLTVVRGSGTWTGGTLYVWGA